MPVSQGYVDYVVDQHSEFGELIIRKMFGGVGLYHEGLMFAMITAKEVFCLKADKSNEAEFEEKGMTRFGATATKKGMPYWEVPAEVLEDKSELAKWAMKSYEVVLKKKKK